MSFVKCVLTVVVAAYVSLASATTYDWTSNSTGVATTQYLGLYDDGTISGRLFRRTVDRVSFSLETAPATPFPASLTYMRSYGDYVLNALNQVIWRGTLTATLWNDDGDYLYATGRTAWVSGAYYRNEYEFDGGLGAYLGAAGWWNSDGVLHSPTYQSWHSVAHLELPSAAAAVSEPATLGMLLGAFGIMGAIARRRKKQIA